MKASDVILAGIAAAGHWPEISHLSTKVRAVGPNTSQYSAPVMEFTKVGEMTESSTWKEERITLDKFIGKGWSIHMGYGPQSDTLVFWIPSDEVML